MPEQLEEHFLNDVLGSFHSETERADIPAQPGRALVECLSTSRCMGGGRLSAVPGERGWERQTERGRILLKTCDASMILHSEMSRLIG